MGLLAARPKGRTAPVWNRDSSLSVFIIGDLQGCCHDFRKLVDALPWKAGDALWLCGDLINRGPESLATLRYLRDFKRPLRCVLGNHDLAVLAHASGQVGKCGKTARELLQAADGPELLDWLQHQDLLVEHEGLVMVHAGIPPQWTLDKAQQEARRVEQKLRSAKTASALFSRMYGDQPARWNDSLRGSERTRFTINALTRMRFVHLDGSLELSNKHGPEHPSAAGLLPWYAHPDRQSRNQVIAFGHWSTLGHSHIAAHNAWGLDSGCVWGGRLTALQWPERRLIHQYCPRHKRPGI